MLTLKEKYELLNKEFLSLDLKYNTLKKELNTKEELLKTYEDKIKALEGENTEYLLEIRYQEDEIEMLNQTVNYLEGEIKRLENRGM